MLRRRAISLVGAAAALVSVSTETSAKSHNAYPCYWVAGRLSAYNGNPTWRIWPKGTSRLLGVVNDTEQGFLPVALPNYRPWKDAIWGEFRVCPVMKERTGWMRMVNLTAARNVKIVPN